METSTIATSYIAFAGSRRIASGDLATVSRAASETVARDAGATVLIFDDATSHRIELDLRGTADDVVAQLAHEASLNASVHAADTPADNSAGDSPYLESAPSRGRGRPKLGVIAREVTLLPRHWDWLAMQPGGASAAVRRLVDEARQRHAARDRRRQAQEAAYRFMSAMAGDEPGFEEATRALFAGDERHFSERTTAWPPDVRDHARALAARAFA